MYGVLARYLQSRKQSFFINESMRFHESNTWFTFIRDSKAVFTFLSNQSEALYFARDSYTCLPGYNIWRYIQLLSLYIKFYMEKTMYFCKIKFWDMLKNWLFIVIVHLCVILLIMSKQTALSRFFSRTLTSAPRGDSRAPISCLLQNLPPRLLNLPPRKPGNLMRIGWKNYGMQALGTSGTPTFYCGTLKKYKQESHGLWKWKNEVKPCFHINSNFLPWICLNQFMCVVKYVYLTTLVIV